MTPAQTLNEIKRQATRDILRTSLNAIESDTSATLQDLRKLIADPHYYPTKQEVQIYRLKIRAIKRLLALLDAETQTK
jgi:hypothetical protein